MGLGPHPDGSLARSLSHGRHLPSVRNILTESFVFIPGTERHTVGLMEQPPGQAPLRAPPSPSAPVLPAPDRAGSEGEEGAGTGGLPGQQGRPRPSSLGSLTSVYPVSWCGTRLGDRVCSMWGPGSHQGNQKPSRKVDLNGLRALQGWTCTQGAHIWPA